MATNWKASIMAIRGAGGFNATVRVAAELLEILGKPMRLRESRSQLFLLSKEVLSSRPKLIRVEEDALVVLIALPDLIEVLSTKKQTLGEGLEEMGFKPATRKPPRVEKRKSRPDAD